MHPNWSTAGFEAAAAAYASGNRDPALVSFLSLGNWGNNPQNLVRDLHKWLGLKITPYHLRVKVSHGSQWRLVKFLPACSRAIEPGFAVGAPMQLNLTSKSPPMQIVLSPYLSDRTVLLHGTRGSRNNSVVPKRTTLNHVPLPSMRCTSTGSAAQSRYNCLCCALGTVSLDFETRGTSVWHVDLRGTGSCSVEGVLGCRSTRRPVQISPCTLHRGCER